MHSLLAIFPSLIEDLAPRRTEEVNAASEMRKYFTFLPIDSCGADFLYEVETHPRAREASRRRLIKSAKRNLEAGLEAQKVQSSMSTCNVSTC